MSFASSVYGTTRCGANMWSREAVSEWMNGVVLCGVRSTGTSFSLARCTR